MLFQDKQRQDQVNRQDVQLKFDTKLQMLSQDKDDF